MITLTLFPVVGGTRFAEFELKSLKQGIDFLLFALENLSQTEEGLSLSIDNHSNKQFSTIHFQQLDNKCFFQVFVSDEQDNVEEGWHCLVNQDFIQEEDDLITTKWDKPDGDYFETRVSEGVLISKSLLVSKNTFENFISKFSEDFSQWYQQGSWINVGLV